MKESPNDDLQGTAKETVDKAKKFASDKIEQIKNISSEDIKEKTDQAKKFASEKIEQIKKISADDVKQKADQTKKMAEEKINQFKKIPKDQKKKYGIIAAIIILFYFFIGGDKARSELIKAVEININAMREERPSMSEKQDEKMRCKVVRNVTYEIYNEVSNAIKKSERCERKLDKIPAKLDHAVAKAKNMEENGDEYAEMWEHILKAEKILINDYCEEREDFDKWAKETTDVLTSEYCTK